MPAPDISVIMSVYNAERFLDESILSVLHQTFRNFEFIIINDGSHDGSLNIIKRYQRKDKRIKLIHNDKNIGLANSLNKGIKISRGRYIARLDADDTCLPQRFAKQYEFLEKNQGIFLCGTDANYIDETGKRINHQHSKVYFNPVSIRKKLLKFNRFIHSSIMFRNQNVYYRGKFYNSQDYDLYLNLLSQDRQLQIIKDKLVNRRRVLSASSFQKIEQMKLFAGKAQEFYRQRIKNGYDDYDNFNADLILQTARKRDPREFLFEVQIKDRLKNGDFKTAAEIYHQKYCKLDKVDIVRKGICFFFVSFPKIYKAYRSIRFNRDKFS